MVLLKMDTILFHILTTYLIYQLEEIDETHIYFFCLIGHKRPLAHEQVNLLKRSLLFPQ